jgi:ElaB/YqjD/DUF883 family membrane-anchored ribosome-binding protein
VKPKGRPGGIKSPDGADSMEVYYKQLISKEASLEKLVDELTRVVQGADELAEAAGAHLTQEASKEMRSCLEQLKESCNRIKEHALAGAVATDKAVRRYPYSSIGIAFGLGLVTATIFHLWRSAGPEED